MREGHPKVYPSAPPLELYGVTPGSLHLPPYPSGPPPYSPPRVPFTNAHHESDSSLIYEEIPHTSQGSSRGGPSSIEEADVVPSPARFNLKSPPPGQAYRHKKLNPHLSARRGCTDVICSFIFALFLAGWAVVAVIGFMWGNPERLIHPTDSLGRICGTDRKGAYNLSSKPFLLYFDITKCLSFASVFAGCQTPQVCVSSCPDKYFSYLELQAPSSNIQAAVHSSEYCVDGVNTAGITTFSALKSLVDNQSCTAYTFASAAVLGRCLPSVLVGAVNDVSQLPDTLDSLNDAHGDGGGVVPSDGQVNQSIALLNDMVSSPSVLMKIASDMSITWWAILTLILAAAIAAFLWTLVMRLLGGVMIWSSILLILGVLAAGSGFCWYKWDALTQAGAINDFSFQPIFSLYFEMPTTWMVLAIAISVVLIIVFLILLCVRTRIKLGVAMIEESSKAIASMMSTLVFPLFPFVLHVVAFLIWASVAIWLASSGEENCRRVGTINKTNPYGDKCDCSSLGTDLSCSYINLTKETTTVLYLQGYNLFAFFWMTCFITALGQISLAGAFASYYWAVDKKKDVPTFPVLRALMLACRYNIGSLAFGSLINAIVWFIRVILEYLDNKLKGTQNPILKGILTGLKCFFWCLDAFLRFLTKNAFIMMAIYGRGFCTSAKDSFFLLARNAIRVVVINNVSAFLLFIGKAFITAGMGVVAYFYFSGRWVIDGLPHIDLYYYFVPIIIVVIGSYFIADLFFDVYLMAVETTFICFLEDSEQNDGSPQKPYFMSQNLLHILGKKNSKVDEKKA